MDKVDAVQLIKFLCWKAGVKEPSEVNWTRNVRRGYYTRPIKRKLPRGRISVGLGAWRGVVEAVLHETAHHLLAMRVPKHTLLERRKIRWTSRRLEGSHAKVSHGYQFVSALEELLTYWPYDYPWETEYASVQRERKRRS